MDCHSVTMHTEQSPRSGRESQAGPVCHAQQDKQCRARRPLKCAAEGAVTAEQAWDQGPTCGLGLAARGVNTILSCGR